MKHNIGSTERIVRAMVGLCILSLTVIGPHSMWGLPGLVPLATGRHRLVPTLLAEGINTCRTKDA